MDRNDLTQGSIWRKLLRFFFPILLGMLFQQLYNTVDAVIVGKYVGKEALAAVGGSPAVIINLVIGFFTGLGSGATVIIAQLFGAKDNEGLKRTLHTAVAFCLIVGVILTVLGYFLTPWSLRIVDTPEDIFDISAVYLRIYFAGTVALLIFNVGSGILRAVGDSRRPLYYLVICCLLNIALDLLFVKNFGMGVSGAGWATVISLAVSAVLVLISLCVTNGPHRLELKSVRIDYPALRRILYIGIPAGVQSAMYAVSNLIIQAGINRLGTTIVAAWTACGKIDGFYWVTSNSLGVAICAFVGQCFGAGKYDRMKKGVKDCMILAQGITVFLVVILMLLARYGLQIITDDVEVIDYAVEMLNYFVPYYIIWSFIEILSGTLRGAGDSIRPMVIIIVGVCVLRVLWMAFVVPGWNTVMGIAMSYPISWTVTALALIIYYYKSNWLNRCAAHV